jgi:hypothetical protein
MADMKFPGGSVDLKGAIPLCHNKIDLSNRTIPDGQRGRERWNELEGVQVEQ